MDRPLSNDNIKKQRWQFLVKAAVVAVIIAILFYGIRSFFTPSVAKDSIRTARVEIQDISATISGSGVVTPIIEETISSEFDSQIINVITQVGSSVKQGDPILQLDTQKLLLEVSNLKEKIALKDTQIESKKLNLNKSINDLNSREALLNVDLESRSTREARLTELSKLGAFSKHDLLEARLDVKRTKIELKQLRQAKLDIESTTKAEVAGLTLERSILQKALAEQERLIDKAIVRASRDGLITWLNDGAGTSVANREPLVKIADTSEFKIVATLSDFYAAQITPEMQVQVRLNDQVLDGHLMRQAPTIENGVMKLQVALQQPNAEGLRHNQRVDIGFITETVRQTPTLAKGPFINGAGLQKVFVIRDNTAYKTDVQVGLSSANHYQIINGLKEGDEVIISSVADFLHLNQISVN